MNTQNWKIDATHSYVGFSVKHMMFTNVKGQFENYEGKIDIPKDSLVGAQLDFKAHINSVNTNNKQRDEHLKSADFFDADQFNTLSFSSEKITGSGTNFTVEGKLTIKGTTQSVQLEAEYSGPMQDPWGNTKSALSLKGKINRKDFGLNWNSTLEAGGVLVGENVNLDIEMQLSL